MAVLVGGMDLSGNNFDENSRYIGIVIGIQEKIDHMIKHLNLPRANTAMDKSSTNRNTLVAKLVFDDNEIMAFCAKIDKIRIVHKIKKRSENATNISKLKKSGMRTTTCY